MDFELREWGDGKWHLFFQDSLHGDDVDLIINPDNTFSLCEYELSPDYQGDPDEADDTDFIEKITPIENIHDFMIDAFTKQQTAWDLWNNRRKFE